VDNFLGVQEIAPTDELHLVERDDFSASILVTNSEPPRAMHSRQEATEREVEVVLRPEGEDRHDTSVAVTSLAVFGTCPRKYYIQRSLGWNSGRFRRFDPEEIAADEREETVGEATEDADDLSASRIGSAVHEILAGLVPADDVPEARRLADVFLKGELGRRVAGSTRVAREWGFIAEIDGTMVRGTVDMWFEDSGEVHVVDYKTDAVTAAAAPARARDYAPQLALYAMALERALGVRPRIASLHFLRPDVVVQISLDDLAIEAARGLIAGLRAAQNDLRFPLHEGEHCSVCPFYMSLCPAGRRDR
jgi:RecB family exonuclease